MKDRSKSLLMIFGVAVGTLAVAVLLVVGAGHLFFHMIFGGDSSPRQLQTLNDSHAAHIMEHSGVDAADAEFVDGYVQRALDNAYWYYLRMQQETLEGYGFADAQADPPSFLPQGAPDLAFAGKKQAGDYALYYTAPDAQGYVTVLLMLIEM